MRKAWLLIVIANLLFLIAIPAVAATFPSISNFQNPCSSPTFQPPTNTPSTQNSAALPKNASPSPCIPATSSPTITPSSAFRSPTLIGSPGTRIPIAKGAPGLQAAAVNTKPLVVTGRDANGAYQFYAMNADGTNQTQLTNAVNPNGYFDPAWSPDSSRIAFAYIGTTQGNSNINLMNADGTGRISITASANYLYGPSWSPDGHKVIFYEYNNPANNAFLRVFDLTTSIETGFLPDAAHDYGNPSYSPDGTKVLFEANRDGILSSIYTINADGNLSSIVRLTPTNATYGAASWSPDGTKIAFVSNRDTQCATFCLYTMNANGTSVSAPLFLSTNRTRPAWSPDGSKIAFISSDSKVHVINANGTNDQTIATGRQYFNLSWQRATPETLLAPYGVELKDDGVQPWTAAEKQAVLDGVVDTASALQMVNNSPDSLPVIFKRVMGMSFQGNIQFWRHANFTAGTPTPSGGSPNGKCATSQFVSPRTVTCYGPLANGTGFVNKFTVVHELGHIFDYRSGQNAAGAISLAQRLGGGSVVRDCVATPLPGTPTPIKTVPGGLVMGEWISKGPNGTPTIETTWTRGVRGWGSGPDHNTNPTSGPLITDFQQNPDFGTNTPSIQGVSIPEAAADTFLNWVYRRLSSSPSGTPCFDTVPGTWNGYHNESWRNMKSNSAIPGTPDSTHPGSKRYEWMDAAMIAIFQQHGW